MNLQEDMWAVVEAKMVPHIECQMGYRTDPWSNFQKTWSEGPSVTIIIHHIELE